MPVAHYHYSSLCRCIASNRHTCHESNNFIADRGKAITVDDGGSLILASLILAWRLLDTNLRKSQGMKASIALVPPPRPIPAITCRAKRFESLLDGILVLVVEFLQLRKIRNAFLWRHHVGLNVVLLLISRQPHLLPIFFPVMVMMMIMMVLKRLRCRANTRQRESGGRCRRHAVCKRDTIERDGCTESCGLERHYSELHGGKGE